MLGKVGTVALLLVGTHIDNFDVAEVEFQTLCQTVQAVGVAQQDRLADAFNLSLNGSLHHGGVTTFSKHYALWVLAGGVVQLACEFRLLSQQLHEALFVSIPVGNCATCYATLDSSFCYGSTYLGDESWVDRFRDEIVRAKGEVVYMINVVHNIGHWLLGQVGDSMYGSHLHFFVDSLGMNVEGTAEDIGETNYVVNLVGVVAASGRHQHVGAACHRIFITNLWHGVCQRKHDGLVGH